jgi:phosphatidylglycerol:prolipoprotein diacylglycerol transferase
MTGNVTRLDFPKPFGSRYSARVHPEAFKLGSMTVYWYGVMVALAFIVGMWTAVRRAPRAGLAPERVADLIPWLIVAGLVGARIWFVVTYWDAFFAGKPWWEVFMIRHGGLVFHGGLIGAVAMVIIYARWKKLPLFKLGDTLTPSIALGHVFGRIGCFLNGCCHGSACDLPWAVRFPPEHATGGEPIHPTQLYEAGLNLLLYAGLAWLYRHKRFDGQVFGVYLIAYAILRAVVEVFRGDYGDHHWGPMTPGQAISGILLVAGVLFLHFTRRAARLSRKA